MAGFVVAITGGIASGKSTVARIFEQMGVSVVDADAIAREIVAPGSEAFAEVVARFGPDFLLPDGTLDRKALRDRVFGNSDARGALEAITHPRIRNLLKARSRTAPGPYCIAEIPLLAEQARRSEYNWLNRILVVDTPSEFQRARLERRAGINPQLARDMVNAQATREQRLAIASDVIINDSAPSQLEPTVRMLHLKYLGLAGALS